MAITGLEDLWDLWCRLDSLSRSLSLVLSLSPLVLEDRFSLGTSSASTSRSLEDMVPISHREWMIDLQSLRQGGGREAWALGGVQTLDSYVVDCEAESFVVAMEEGGHEGCEPCRRMYQVSSSTQGGEEARTGLIASTSTPCCCSSWSESRAGLVVSE